MKLNHLVFVDNLVMFSHSNKESISLLLKCLTTFATSSGLNANTGKSNIYCCNIPPKEKEEIVKISGFKQDSLPSSIWGSKLVIKSYRKMTVKFW